MLKSEPVPFALGDVLRLKKPHPCGGYDWTVVRLGADIGLKCQTCGRRVLLSRRELERRVKMFLSHGAEAGEDLPGDNRKPVDMLTDQPVS